MRRGCALITRLLLFSLLVFASGTARAQTGSQTIYDDALQNGWQDYSWATVNFANASPVHGGRDSIRVDAPTYAALYFHHAAQSASNFANVTFWINGGATGGQKLQVQAVLNGSALPGSYGISPLPANTWEQVSVPLADLGATSNFDGIWIQDTSGNTEPTFYVDDVSLGPAPPPVTVAGPPNPSVTISVDAAANRHPISPLVYGISYAGTAQLADLNSPLNRWGGNESTRYNWQTNASSLDADVFFESQPSGSNNLPGVGSGPGGDADAFIGGTQAGGAQPMLAIPMIGWVAKLSPTGGRLASFSVAKYGPQQQADPGWPDAGNGVKADGTFVKNDPTDANQTADVNFQADWLNHLLGQWGTAANGGVKYYFMDNEPSLWSSTHRDVHPDGPGMDEVLGDIEAYGAKVKSLDPSALVLGPEEWGYIGYLYSGADQQVALSLGYDPTKYPDRKAHGGVDYIPYLLDQLRQYDQAHHQRVLDVLSVHFYPQGDTQGHQEYGDDTSTATQLLRNRSTRNLWDPRYTAENYIGQPVQLIPRLKNWVNTYYPGTKIAITEYNWGAEDHINGATAQADIWGILGREGLDMATRWTTPYPSSPSYKAMKLYRNYDGNKSTFGDVSVSDSAPNPDNVSSFASVRSSDGALTVMVISKYLSGDTPLTLSLANFKAGATAQAWQLTSANAITRLADVPVTNSILQATLPLQSVTLFVIPAATTTISGKVSLQGVKSGNMGQPITFTFTPTGATTGAVAPQTVTLNATDGSFALTGVPPGAYTLGVKGAKWLRRDVSIDTTAGPLANVSVSLLGGDATGDNKVNASDFLALHDAYLSASGDGTGRYRAAADFNCDGKVNASDFLILHSNYLQAGDK